MGKGPSAWGWGLGGGSYLSLGEKGRHSAKGTFAESEGVSDADGAFQGEEISKCRGPRQESA